MALFDILPFGLGDSEPQLSLLQPGRSLWTRASGYQCLRLLKYFGVEQQALANHLGVTTSSVSMWMHRVRAVPAKYEDAIRAYTEVIFTHAAERLNKEVEALPQPLRLAAVMEWWTGLRRWELEVQHEEGVLLATVQAGCRQVGAFADKTTLTADDRQALRRLCSTLQVQLRTLDEIETEPDESRGE